MIKAQVWNGDHGAAPPERRRYFRVPIAVQIEIRCVGTDVPMRLQTTDISLGGCYVEMALTLEIGTQLDIVLWLDQHKVCTKGVIVTKHSQFGNGVKFAGMSAENEAILFHFLDSQDVSRRTNESEPDVLM